MSDLVDLFINIFRERDNAICRHDERIAELLDALEKQLSDQGAVIKEQGERLGEIIMAISDLLDIYNVLSSTELKDGLNKIRQLAEGRRK